MKNSFRSTKDQELMSQQNKGLLKYEAPQIHTYTQAEIFEMMGPAQGCTTNSTNPDCTDPTQLLGG